MGATLQKNGLGRRCLISGFFLVWTFINRWRNRAEITGRYEIAAEFVLLIMTAWLFRGPSAWAASSTAIASFAIGIAFYLGLLWMRKRQLNLSPNLCAAVISCIIAVGAITPLVGGSTVTGFTSMLGRDQTLTGRTEIWATLLPALER